MIKECYIDKLKDEADQDIGQDIGFDFSLLKRNELNVNLIHFDLNMTNPENYDYYNNFKVDVVGGFHAMDNLDMFQKYLEKINSKNIPFIVMSSGSSGKDVIPICKQYPFVKEVIIFCGNYDYNKHYLDEYPGYVKKVFTEIKDVYKYISSFGPDKYKEGIKKYRNSDQFIFSYDDIKMDKQLEQCPVITAYEYDKCYFLVHRAYAHFFGDINNKNDQVTFKRNNFNKIKDLINNSSIIDSSNKEELLSKFQSLINSKIFVELSIRKYTEESSFCYVFNKIMRNFESGLISLAYYMGPLLYGLNKYVKENPQNFSFSEDMTLYRKIKCNIYDFYLYKMNLKHIICFPSITSTSTTPDEFIIGTQAQNLNNNECQNKELIYVKMIFNYKHEPRNISPGIIIKDYLASDGEPISIHPDENEVILFPFTFARLTRIEEKGNNLFEMYLDIINRKEYIEYTLKKDVEKRARFSELD